MESQRWAAAETVRKKQSAYREAQAALRDRLVAQAERRQRAEAVRAYVLAGDSSPAAQAEDYADWRSCALSEADGVVPLLDGSAPLIGCRRSTRGGGAAGSREGVEPDAHNRPSGPDRRLPGGDRFPLDCPYPTQSRTCLRPRPEQTETVFRRCLPARYVEHP
ncbi:hypothetical protein GCM10009116_10010 [Brevundimonas basaltis]